MVYLPVYLPYKVTTVYLPDKVTHYVWYICKDTAL